MRECAKSASGVFGWRNLCTAKDPPIPPAPTRTHSLRYQNFAFLIFATTPGISSQNLHFPFSQKLLDSSEICKSNLHQNSWHSSLFKPHQSSGCRNKKSRKNGKESHAEGRRERVKAAKERQVASGAARRDLENWPEDP